MQRLLKKESLYQLGGQVVAGEAWIFGKEMLTFSKTAEWVVYCKQNLS